MAKLIRYTDEQIETARKKLRGLEAQNLGRTRRETAALLSADVRKAVQKGYTLKQIRAVLSEAGLAISLDRLKALLNGSEGNRQTKPTENGGVSRGMTPVPDEKLS